MADDANLAETERVQERQHICGMLVRSKRPYGFIAVAEPAQIWREHGVAIGEPRHDRLPGQPEFGPAMQQQQRRPFAGPRDMEGRAVGWNRQMLHRGCSLSFRRAH